MLSLGDIEEFPGLDPIPAYPIQIDQTTNEVKINITPKNKQKGNDVIKPLCKSDDANEDIVLIIGSGHIYLSISQNLSFFLSSKVFLNDSFTRIFLRFNTTH